MSSRGPTDPLVAFGGRLETARRHDRDLPIHFCFHAGCVRKNDDFECHIPLTETALNAFHRQTIQGAAGNHDGNFGRGHHAGLLPVKTGIETTMAALNMSGVITFSFPNSRLPDKPFLKRTFLHPVWIRSRGLEITGWVGPICSRIARQTSRAWRIRRSNFAPSLSQASSPSARPRAAVHLLARGRTRQDFIQFLLGRGKIIADHASLGAPRAFARGRRCRCKGWDAPPPGNR